MTQLYTYELLQLNHCPAVKDWYLRIDTIDELFNYYNNTLPNKVENAFKEYLEVDVFGRKHYGFSGIAGRYAAAIALTAKCRETTFLDSMNSLNNKLISGQLEKLVEGNIVLINCNGGWTHDTQDRHRYTVLQIKQTDNLVYPHKNIEDVRYIKWEGGSHWYAKIGNIDIVDSKGNQKWNTKAEAEKVAKEFVKYYGD